MLSESAFILFSLAALAGAIVAVTIAGAHGTVVGLALNVAGVAGLLMLQRADFLAGAMTIVFMGEVVSLLVFVTIGNSGASSASEMAPDRGVMTVAAFMAAGLAVTLVCVLWTSPLPESPPSDVKARELGEALLVRYPVPFAAVFLLFLMACTGAFLVLRKEQE